MYGISVNEAALICGGKLNNSCDTEIRNICIDSRKVEKGSMFAAFRGETVDGHDYMAKAFELGAACCLAEYIPEGVTGSVITVPDVEKAMKTLAEEFRSRLAIPVIGITGSVGKTTAKEMVASVLSQKYRVLKTDKNFNNELGVPLTVSRIDREHEVAIIEMGISDFGEMARLAKIVRPTMALYTIIGMAHLEALHDREGVLKAKTEMVDFLPENGTLFLNGDDDLLSRYDCVQERIFFGTGENADVRAENIVSSSLTSTECDVVCGDRRISVHIPAYGRHMIYAALEGAAVGIKMGLSDAEIAAGIAAYETVGRRANISDTGTVTLIDDCYNANPTSTKCAIDSLSDNTGRRVCILGDMLGQGKNAEKVHYDIGAYAAASGAALVLTVGKLSKHTCEGAKTVCSMHFESNAELIAKLPELIQKGDAVLVKASNSMHFDEISEALKKLQ